MSTSVAKPLEPLFDLPRRVTRRASRDLRFVQYRLGGYVSAVPNLRWLLIATFPNGGSTAFSDLLGNSVHAVRLKSNYEGQWLIPELADTERRMLDQDLVSRDKLRYFWLEPVREIDPNRPKVVIEKSPDNMFRWNHICDSLSDMPQTRVVLTRSPLPTIASWMKRYDWSIAGARWGDTFGVSGRTREDQLWILAQLYLRRAKRLLACRETADLYLSYEALCADPEYWLDEIAGHEPLLSDVDGSASLRVKDYSSQGLRNMNAENEALLAPEDRKLLLEGLSEGADILHELGYGLDVEGPLSWSTVPVRKTS